LATQGLGILQLGEAPSLRFGYFCDIPFDKSLLRMAANLRYIRPIFVCARGKKNERL
jgi:hypothetical protein